MQYCPRIQCEPSVPFNCIVVLNHAYPSWMQHFSTFLPTSLRGFHRLDLRLSVFVEKCVGARCYKVALNMHLCATSCMDTPSGWPLGASTHAWRGLKSEIVQAGNVLQPEQTREFLILRNDERKNQLLLSIKALEVPSRQNLQLMPLSTLSRTSICHNVGLDCGFTILRS